MAIGVVARDRLMHCKQQSYSLLIPLCDAQSVTWSKAAIKCLIQWLYKTLTAAEWTNQTYPALQKGCFNFVCRVVLIVLSRQEMY